MMNINKYIDVIRERFDYPITFSHDDDGMYTAVFYNVPKIKIKKIENDVFNLYYDGTFGDVPFVTVICYTPEETNRLFPEFAVQKHKTNAWTSYCGFSQVLPYSIDVDSAGPFKKYIA